MDLVVPVLLKALVGVLVEAGGDLVEDGAEVLVEDGGDLVEDGAEVLVKDGGDLVEDGAEVLVEEWLGEEAGVGSKIN